MPKNYPADLRDLDGRGAHPEESAVAEDRIPGRNCLFLSGRSGPRPSGQSLLFDSGRSSLETAQVVKLGPPHAASPGYFQGFDQRGKHGKDSLDTDSGGDSSNGEVGGWAFPIRQTDDNPLECLDTFTVPFPDAEVDSYSITRTKGRNIGVGIDFYNLSRFHDIYRLR